MSDQVLQDGGGYHTCKEHCVCWWTIISEESNKKEPEFSWGKKTMVFSTDMIGRASKSTKEENFDWKVDRC